MVGQVVPFHIDLAAAHKPGWANVSVVDLAANKVLATVKSWSVWPDAVSGAVMMACLFDLPFAFVLGRWRLGWVGLVDWENGERIGRGLIRDE